MPCLLSPDTDHITTERVCPMASRKHVAVGGRDSQRSRWHLTDPKVGRQCGARVRDSGSRPEGGSSSSVQHDQSAGSHCHSATPPASTAPLASPKKAAAMIRTVKMIKPAKTVHDRRGLVRLEAGIHNGWRRRRGEPTAETSPAGRGTASHAASMAQPRQTMIMINGQAFVPAGGCQPAHGLTVSAEVDSALAVNQSACWVRTKIEISATLRIPESSRAT